VTNVSGRDVPVKRDEPPSGAAPRSLGRDSLEISRLLIEVMQTSPAGRAGAGAGGAVAAGADQARSFTASTAGAGQHGASSGHATSHVIRAAIYVYTHGPQTIGQLATGLGVSQGWASRIVDEMERAGYLERQRDPADRRVVRVSLAPAAVERVERVYRWRGDAVESALEGMSPEERAAVEGFLRRYVAAAREGG
jgi:DNA-binding MarR family transcriptional regulator